MALLGVAARTSLDREPGPARRADALGCASHMTFRAIAGDIDRRGRASA
jgi:hypothetical protein